MCAAGHLLLIQPATQVARSPFPRPGRERPITHDGLFSFSSFCPPRVLFIYKKYTTSPDTEEKQTQRIQIDRNFSQYAAQSDTATFFSLSRRRNSPPYYRPSINTTVAALIPPAPLQMRINIKEQKKKKIKRRRRKEKKEKIIKKK